MSSFEPPQAQAVPWDEGMERRSDEVLGLLDTIARLTAEIEAMRAADERRAAEDADFTERALERLAQLGDRMGVEDLDPEGRWHVASSGAHQWCRWSADESSITHQARVGQWRVVEVDIRAPYWRDVPGGVRDAIRAANAEVGG